MFRKSLIALAAAASLGTLALSSTDASAFGRGFGGGGMHVGGGMHIGGGQHFGGGFHPIFRPGLHRVVNWHPHWHPHWHFGWRRPYWIAPVVGVGYSAGYAAYSAPATSRCTCLTKEYTQEGAVVFKDVCTNESAINGPNQASSAETQQPAMSYAEPQEGYAQPPQAYAQPSQGYAQPQYH
jgi:hypothetical protein